MIVTEKTKISKIIKEKPESLDAIVSINKHFNKLRNPVLRRILASRVTVAEASRIGEVSIVFFLNKLASIGFEIELPKGESGTNISGNDLSKTPLKSDLISFDVRPIIASGSDPFKEIMKRVELLQVGETLEIINSFEPIPLINILKNKGFDCSTERKDPTTVHAFFKKMKVVEDNEETVEVPQISFDEKYKTFIGKMKCIDVRDLEMPEPMTTILSELEKLPTAHSLFVDHKKNPQFLLPELKQRGFEILYNRKSETHLQLLIYKH